MIAIIDYDAGNIKSVEKALQKLGQDVVITRKKEQILAADKVILPGVGAFGDAMKNLNEYGLVEVIHQVVEKRIPFLGICLGLQLLFEKSDESDQEGFKIPHMGWNSLHLQNDGRLFRGIEEDAYVYFVHSYYLKAKEEQIVKATTEYGAHIHASVEMDNVFACQFHPEKSGETGLKILKNFTEL